MLRFEANAPLMENGNTFPFRASRVFGDKVSLVVNSGDPRTVLDLYIICIQDLGLRKHSFEKLTIWRNQVPFAVRIHYVKLIGPLVSYYILANLCCAPCGIVDLFLIPEIVPNYTIIHL